MPRLWVQGGLFGLVICTSSCLALHRTPKPDPKDAILFSLEGEIINFENERFWVGRQVGDTVRICFDPPHHNYNREPDCTLTIGVLREMVAKKVTP
jgi:hypothetical protein